MMRKCCMDTAADVREDYEKRVKKLESAMQKIISFHNTHSEVAPEDYMAVVGPVIEQSKSILEEK